MNSTAGNFSPAACRRVAVMLMVLCVFPAMMASTRAGSHPKIEASFSVTNLVTDPFDYTVTDVRVQITQPDSSTLSLPAFFDGGTIWRVRHTPMLPGLYQVTGITLNGLPLAVSNLQPASWTVGGTPTSPGFVRVDPANTNRFVTSNGRRHFPVGHNVAWWTNNTQLAGVISKLGGARENWSRIWMTHFYDSLNLEWPKVGSFGQYSLPVAQKWDAIVSAAEQGGVSFQMVLQHHGQYSTSTDPNWNDNPYNTANGGFLSSAAQFFTNTTAKAYTKRKYRYVMARWGYSPAIMAWELFNEVQFTVTATGQAEQWSNIAAWHNEMAQFIRSQDSYQHLITTSSELSQSIWSQCDYYQYHVYTADYISALRDPPGVPGGQPLKPIFGGECGKDNTPYFGFHAPLWAGLMNGQSGAAEQWFGDALDAEKAYGLFHAGRDFALFAGLAEQNTLTKSAPQVAGGTISPLVFGLGGDFTPATQDTFTVGNSAPDGAGTAPPYLQSQSGHPGWTPNGYTFYVNYPMAGTFSVQIVIIARAGAGLLIYLDNVVVSSNSFPATPSDVSTNLTITVNVPAGTHTIKLWNQGQDWIRLGSITLNPYVLPLGAYQIGNTNFAALWLWHRTNIYYPNATATVSGTFPLSGLQPGNYNATWWDTFAGIAISNFNFTIVGSNAVTLATPPILRSVALFAGTPQQAGINAPVLTRTLGTNSPPLSLPLSITNSGGLPLSYSLCVTGANPVAYTAINSTQFGGSVFAWKDISVIGRELTTNFTALTAKAAKDEGITGPVEIGFGFPFFSGAQSPDIFTQLYVSPNGFVAFNPFTGDTSTNKTLPGLQAPTNLIAFFWDDLDLTSGGRIYATSDSIAGAFTLQFQDVRFKGSGLTVNCQLILKTTGEILMQYKSMGISNACTVGVQNAAGNQGLPVAYNQNYLQSNFAVRLRPASWLGISANAGLAPRSSADTINLLLDPSGLGYGTYLATVLVKTSDPAQALVSLPVTLSVTPIATWRQSHFGAADNAGIAADTADPEGDGWINIVEYAFNLDPLAASPNPLVFSFPDGHLTVTFNRPHPAPSDISYLIEVTDDLASGVWNSGPGYTVQSVTDNFDGTETVVVTDLAASPSPAAHFLRVRISAP